jgi:deoxyadenosine/deoxycytidine kinase
MNKVFSIEGNIGSGKSTILQKLKELYSQNFVFLPEPVDIWNTIKDTTDGKTILQKYYADQERYAFSFQMMAYITRLSQLKEAMKKHTNSIIITERCLHTDREIFAKMLYNSGKIEPINYLIYNRWFDEFNELPLDGLIYIETVPEICLSRICKRNRPGEESIPLEYLVDCHNQHSSWINSTNIPVLRLENNGDIDLIPQILNFVKYY